MAKPRKVYVRFVCYRRVQSQKQRLGLFQAIQEARDSDFAPPWALQQISELNDWFDDNLHVPKKFSFGGWKGLGQPGLSWFKPVATEHIRKMHQMKIALDACGVSVDILTTTTPGRIIWQDDNQIVAEPGNRKF